MKHFVAFMYHPKFLLLIVLYRLNLSEGCNIKLSVADAAFYVIFN